MAELHTSLLNAYIITGFTGVSQQGKPKIRGLNYVFIKRELFTMSYVSSTNYMVSCFLILKKSKHSESQDSGKACRQEEYRAGRMAQRVRPPATTSSPKLQNPLGGRLETTTEG